MRKEQIITTTNNNQMEEKGMKQRFIHFKRKFVPALSGAIMGVMLMSTTCFAAGGTSAVTQPLENLKTLHYPCKKCYGICTGIPAAGFIYYELSFKGSCGRYYHGRYFYCTHFLRLLR